MVDYFKQKEQDAATWTNIIVSNPPSDESNRGKQRLREAKVDFVMDGSLEYVYKS